MLLTTLTTANLRLYQGPLVADLRYPVTLSYTGIARVESVGPGVAGLAPGDHVYPNWYRACGHCSMCRADRMVGCENVPESGHNMLIGEQYESGLQDYVVLPEDRLWRVPNHVPLESAALIGALGVSLQATLALRPGPGDTLLVVGAGPIGWGILQHAKLRGARVVMVDVRQERLVQATIYGADATVLSAGDGEAAVVDACGGPPLFVADASGTVEGSRLAFSVAARGASVAAVGVTTNSLSQHFLILKGLTVYGIGGALRHQRVIELLAVGKLDMAAAITHRYHFSGLTEAFERMRTDPEAVRIAITFSS